MFQAPNRDVIKANLPYGWEILMFDTRSFCKLIPRWKARSWVQIDISSSWRNSAAERCHGGSHSKVRFQLEVWIGLLSGRILTTASHASDMVFPRHSNNGSFRIRRRRNKKEACYAMPYKILYVTKFLTSKPGPDASQYSAYLGR